MRALKSPYKERSHYVGFTKPLYRRGFAVEVLQRLSVGGASLWMLHEVPLYKRLCKAPIKRGFIM